MYWRSAACPPEDVGGFSGYGYFLEAISDPLNEDYKSMLMWVCGAFNPELFSKDEVNAKLWKIFRKVIDIRHPPLPYFLHVSRLYSTLFWIESVVFVFKC